MTQCIARSVDRVGCAKGLGSGKNANIAREVNKDLVPPAGFEPATFGLQNRCSTN